MRKEYITDPDKWVFPFILCCPENAKGKLPLILQLHGAGERGGGGQELPILDVHGFTEKLDLETDYPCIIAAPQCPKGSFWIAEIPSIMEFLAQLRREFDIDENRIYLTGISMGAYGTWVTAARHPDVFAAIAPVCGGGMVWTADLLKMPIWAFHGTEDNVVYPSESMNMISKVRQNANPDQDVRLTMLDGVGHNAWDYTFDEALLNWLLSKHK